MYGIIVNRGKIHNELLYEKRINNMIFILIFCEQNLYNYTKNFFSVCLKTVSKLTNEYSLNWRFFVQPFKKYTVQTTNYKIKRWFLLYCLSTTENPPPLFFNKNLIKSLVFFSAVLYRLG